MGDGFDDSLFDLGDGAKKGKPGAPAAVSKKGATSTGRATSSSDTAPKKRRRPADGKGRAGKRTKSTPSFLLPPSNIRLAHIEIEYEDKQEKQQLENW
jgi:hypothetical protein